MPPALETFQRVYEGGAQRPKKFNRADHIWTPVDGEGDNVRWKCITCGGITTSLPPSSPTPKDWMPQKYEKLTDNERVLDKKCR